MLKQVTFVDIFSQQKMRTLRDYLHCELDLSVSIPYKIWIAIANFFIQNNVPSVVEGAECCQKDSSSSHYLLVFSYRDKDANRVVVDCINFINVLRDLKVHDVICTKHYVYLYVRHSSAHHNVHAILPFLHHVLQSYVNDKTTTLPLDYTFDPLEEQESFFDVIPVTYHGTYEVTTSTGARGQNQTQGRRTVCVRSPLLREALDVSTQSGRLEARRLFLLHHYTEIADIKRCYKVKHYVHQRLWHLQSVVLQEVTRFRLCLSALPKINAYASLHAAIHLCLYVCASVCVCVQTNVLLFTTCRCKWRRN